MKNLLDKVCKIFFIIVFCLSCFTTNSDNLSGYWGNRGTVLIITKFLIVFVLVSFAGIINRKNLKFIAEFESKAVVIITALLIFDYYVTKFSGSMFLYKVWWIAAIFVAQGALFISASITKNKNYDYFYKKFWTGFTPLYIFTIIICFLRMPFQNKRTINTTPFNGTFLMLKAFIEDVNISFEIPLIFFGNLIIFIPLPFVLSLLKKLKPLHTALIGIVTPILVEGYQYIFSCGDVDIDDLILNWLGFFAGFALQKIIYKARINGNKKTIL